MRNIPEFKRFHFVMRFHFFFTRLMPYVPCSVAWAMKLPQHHLDAEKKEIYNKNMVNRSSNVQKTLFCTCIVMFLVMTFSGLI